MKYCKYLCDPEAQVLQSLEFTIQVAHSLGQHHLLPETILKNY
jgi:hypothetical protein